MSVSTNQRVYDRIPVRNQVRVVANGRLGMVAAMAINLSMGGVLLSAATPLKVGSVCDVTLLDAREHPILAQGTVVRSDSQGSAIRFAKELEVRDLKALASSGRILRNSLVGAYARYFQVGRNQEDAASERLLGVSTRTFRTVFYSTFAVCIPAAILPVWFLRAAIQPFPGWEKIVACFLYASIWYLFIQPTLDLLVMTFLRRRHSAPSRVS